MAVAPQSITVEVTKGPVMANMFRVVKGVGYVIEEMTPEQRKRMDVTIGMLHQACAKILSQMTAE